MSMIDSIVGDETRIALVAALDQAEAPSANA